MHPDRRRYAVAAGDVAALAIVLAWGYVHHARGVADLLRVADLVETTGPFLLGYLVVAALLGAYEADRTTALAWSLRTATAAWAGGLGLGLVARTHPTIEGGAAWPFGLVVLASGLVALVAWRLAAHWLLPAAPTDARRGRAVER